MPRTREALSIPLSQYRCSTKVWSNTNVKHTNERNFQFLEGFVWWTGKTHLPYRTIKTTIFKLMALRDTLVYDSDNWSTYSVILVCSFQWCVLFLCLAKLYRSCPIRDKGLWVGSPGTKVSNANHFVAFSCPVHTKTMKTQTFENDWSCDLQKTKMEDIDRERIVVFSGSWTFVNLNNAFYACAVEVAFIQSRSQSLLTS